MKASEIVRRAEQIADLVNSDYISHDENEALLNENYKNIYQKIINTNDRYFLKEFDLTTGESGEGNTTSLSFPLPTDFYQLNLIAYGGEQVFRMTATQPTGTKCYELRRDKLILHACQIDDNLKIEYYPTPEKIILADEGKKVYQFLFDTTRGYPWNGVDKILAVGEQGQIAFVDKSNQIYIAFSENENYNVGDYQGIIRSIDFVGNIVTAVNSDNSLIMFCRNNLNQVDYKAVFYSDSYFFFVDTQNKLNVITDNEAMFQQLNVDLSNYSELLAFLEGSINISVSSGNVFTDDFDKIDFYRVSGNGRIDKFNGITKETEFVYQSPVNCNLLSFFNGSVFSLDNVLKSIFKNGELIANHIDTLNADNRTDEQPVFASLQGDCVLLSSFETDLTHPQNIFFEMIAYSMAQSYAIKQGKDATAITEKLSQIEEQFFDTLTRDSFQPMRMPNVYNNQGYNRGW